MPRRHGRTDGRTGTTCNAASVQLVDASRVVHQSYRRLDVDVFTLRLRRSARVRRRQLQQLLLLLLLVVVVVARRILRRRQRPSSPSRPAHPPLDAAASVRHAAVCAAAAAAHATQGPGESVRPGLTYLPPTNITQCTDILFTIR